ncbi:hypothetical protein HanIR_Chr16g0791771 [Helianthus annuus]|nr:hypothetical protein HanIR_Chr16g0791771 [Helianthus annuus]
MHVHLYKTKNTIKVETVEQVGGWHVWEKWRWCWWGGEEDGWGWFVFIKKWAHSNLYYISFIV